MTKTTCATAALWMGLAGLVTGCLDVPPAPPLSATGEAIKALTPTHPTERAVAQELLDAHEAYRYRLEVLQAYYTHTGAQAKRIWTERELKNLQQAQTFEIQGLNPAPVGPRPAVDQATELSVVEPVVAARKAYLAAVDKLAAYYTDSGQHIYAALVNSVRRRLDPVRTYMYVLSAEIPPADLRPVRVIKEAELLYAEALDLHKKGNPLPGIVDYNKQRQALAKFLKLVRTYPDSTKIALSAFYIAEIYKEYFNENHRAVAWYERAWQWDPQITKPARFQAAVIHDLRLHHRDRAIGLYYEVLRKETFNRSNVWFARRRIRQLTGADPDLSK